MIQVHWLVTGSVLKLSSRFWPMKNTNASGGHQTVVSNKDIIIHGFSLLDSKRKWSGKLPLKVKENIVKYCKEVGIEVDKAHL